MKNFYLKFPVIAFFLIGSTGLFAQHVITEHSRTNPGSTIKYKHHFDESSYVNVLDESGKKIYTRSQQFNQNVPEGENETNVVTLSFNLNFDPDQYTPLYIMVYDEFGNLGFADWQGTNPVILDVLEGTYDIFVEFIDYSQKSSFIIKEQESVQENTTIEIEAAEATNYVSINIFDQNGNNLEPGVLNSQTGNYSEIFFDRFLYFLPLNFDISLHSYIWDTSFYGEDPIWNFYINDVSDRYAVIQSAIGTGYEGNNNYFNKFATLKGITESVILENSQEDWVFHREKFQQSALGVSSGKVYPAFSTLNTYNGKGKGGWTVELMGETMFNPEEGFKAYLNNPFDDDPADLLVFPAIVDYIGIINPDWGEEGFLIKGDAILKDGNEVLYGSGVPHSTIWYFLGDLFYYDESGGVGNVLPFHPQFTFSVSDDLDVIQGNNVPVSSVGISNKIRSNYIGRYGEKRDSDFFATTAEVKQNGNVVFSGNYIDDGFLNYTLPETGNFEVTFTNTNIEVDGLAGKNITRLQFDKGQEDDTPPTLQHLQFRNTDGKVTDRFASVSDGTVRLAAGDFQFTENEWGSGYFIYNEGNTVELYYSLYDQDDWTELELTEYPEYFQMPAFGDYYEASLASIQNTESDVWYDVRIICTDAAGNKQEQIVSPAFKLNITVGTEDLLASPGVFYPNPVTDILTVENLGNEPCSVNILNTLGKVVYSGPVTNESTQSINMKSLNIPSGMYFIQLVSDHKTIAGKKLIFIN